ncbi:hypothetical protein SORBI_3006G233400 [Sorghum bicolor]|uniref:Uncharacterized protein n=1 Tax=Sorghum bicolor TaxID=4558 RepID=A0A1B6PNI0_SORBI|nr:hypothetical protein SORBI_3006G233400 [Sorghum bicolor]
MPALLKLFMHVYISWVFFSASSWSENALQQWSWLWLLDSFVALLSFWLDWEFFLVKSWGKIFIHPRVNRDLSE